MLLFILLLVFIGVALALAWYLVGHDHGAREPVGALWLAAGFGILGALAAGLLESRLVNSQNLLYGLPSGTMLGTALAIGAIEEVCKFVPLAIYIYKRAYFNEHTDGVIYFALAGLSFGLPENLLYTLQFGAKAGVLRLFLTPFFHAAATGVAGYYLAKGKLAGRSPWLVLAPLAAVIVLHGLYDFGLASGVAGYALGAVSITLGLSMALFVLFLKATEHDQDRGLSVVGHNAFCRACGAANPRHNLYCVRCGQHA